MLYSEIGNEFTQLMCKLQRCSFKILSPSLLLDTYLVVLMKPAMSQGRHDTRASAAASEASEHWLERSQRAVSWRGAAHLQHGRISGIEVQP